MIRHERRDSEHNHHELSKIFQYVEQRRRETARHRFELVAPLSRACVVPYAPNE